VLDPHRPLILGTGSTGHLNSTVTWPKKMVTCIMEGSVCRKRVRGRAGQGGDVFQVSVSLLLRGRGRAQRGGERTAQRGTSPGGGGCVPPGRLGKGGLIFRRARPGGGRERQREGEQGRGGPGRGGGNRSVFARKTRGFRGVPVPHRAETRRVRGSLQKKFVQPSQHPGARVISAFLPGVDRFCWGWRRGSLARGGTGRSVGAIVLGYEAGKKKKKTGRNTHIEKKPRGTNFHRGYWSFFPPGPHPFPQWRKKGVGLWGAGFVFRGCTARPIPKRPRRLPWGFNFGFTNGGPGDRRGRRWGHPLDRALAGQPPPLSLVKARGPVSGNPLTLDPRATIRPKKKLGRHSGPPGGGV